MSRQKRGELAPTSDQDALLAKVKALKQQVESLEQQVHRLQLERDVLEVTADILKKDLGADPKQLTNREKATAIGALRTQHPLDELLTCLGIAKSSYFYQRTALSVPDKYAELRERVSSAP